MSIPADTNQPQKIDVERVLFSKNPTLAKAVPRFIINYLKKIVHQDDLNVFMNEYGDLKDSELIGAALSHFKINYKVSGIEKLPKNGKHIFVSNHPLGGLDGLVFIYELSKISI